MKNTCILFLEETAEKFPNKIAVKNGINSITFKDLVYRSKLISQHIDLKIKNKPVLILLPKSVEAIVSFFATLYSGNFYVPVDLNSPIDRLGLLINNLQPSIIITNDEYISLAESLNIDFKKVVNISEINYTQKKDFKFINLNSVIDTDPIYCIFTSGSTGVPKGVLISHRSVIDYIEWAIYTFKIDENEIIGNQAPLYFDNSTLDIYLMVFTGSTLNLIPEINFLFPLKLLEYVNAEKINFIFWVPSIMTNFETIDLFKNFTFLHLNKILFAGEVMPVKTLNYWRKYFKSTLFANLYGPTEITVDCTYYIVEREFDLTESLPIGFPCRNTDVLVLNGHKKAELGELGELCVRGTSLALGYWNDFEKTDKVFVQNPLNKNYYEKIYRTGDLVKYNDFNEIIYIGRIDSQIKHNGYRIELGEIENFVQSISGINFSCVLYDDKNKQIVVFYESSQETISIDYFISYLKNKLPKYMIPHKYVKLDKMLFNKNGKIDKVALKDIISN